MISVSSMSDVSFGTPAERTVKARMRAARRERVDERVIWCFRKNLRAEFVRLMALAVQVGSVRGNC